MPLLPVPFPAPRHELPSTQPSPQQPMQCTRKTRAGEEGEYTRTGAELAAVAEWHRHHAQHLFH
eukprot:12400715-Prorocentrum_lima.AAC.1